MVVADLAWKGQACAHAALFFCNSLHAFSVPNLRGIEQCDAAGRRARFLLVKGRARIFATCSCGLRTEEGIIVRLQFRTAAVRFRRNGSTRKYVAGIYVIIMIFNVICEHGGGFHI